MRAQEEPLPFSKHTYYRIPSYIRASRHLDSNHRTKQTSIKERKASYSSIKALAEMDLAMRYLCVAALVSTLARINKALFRGAPQN